MAENFPLPDVGEGLTEAEIVSWKVKPGDTVDVNQVFVEIETAKSLVELPSPHAGVIGELLVDEGETVEVGTPIISFDTGDESDAGGSGGSAVGNSAAGSSAAGDTSEEDSGATLVGYGAKPSTRTRRPRKKAGAPQSSGSSAAGPQAQGPQQSGPQAQDSQQAASQQAASQQAPAAPPAPAAVASATPDLGKPAAPDLEETARPQRALAKPPVRKLAKNLGVDLNDIAPTGANGEVTRDDVNQAAGAAESDRAPSAQATQPAQATQATQPAQPAASGTAPQAAAGERETRIPVKGVRKMTAQAMVSSAFTAPHVSLFLDVDVTRTVQFVDELKQSKALGDDVRVSPLLIMAKAVTWAAGRNPTINSVFTPEEIILKNYVNLGIAAATDRGLIVPNIKDADTMNLTDLARAIGDLVSTARSGKTPPADQAGGTITITNVGVFGVDTGTPIINPGESAIVAFGQIRKRPWVVGDDVVPRDISTLGLSADHRVVDGDVASKFLADVGRALEQPAMLLS